MYMPALLCDYAGKPNIGMFAPVQLLPASCDCYCFLAVHLHCK